MERYLRAPRAGVVKPWEGCMALAHSLQVAEATIAALRVDLVRAREARVESDHELEAVHAEFEHR